MGDILSYSAMGQRIRGIRKAARMTQKDLADKVGISLSFLGHMERGSRKCSIETVMSLCKAMGVSPNDLLADSITWPTGRKQGIEKALYTQIQEMIDDFLRDDAR